MSSLNESFFNHIVEKMTTKRNVFGSVLCVEKDDNTISWVGGAGNIKEDDQYFIASVTKLYITAVIFKLKAENRLKLEDKISKYLCDDLIRGIHVMNEKEYSNDITILQLISNTSGIPDYFSQKQSNGKNPALELLNGKDEPWPLEKTLTIVKTIKPKFRPGQKGKVNYSDTNYQLLGKIIEIITEKSIQDVFKKFIFDELNLSKTYVYEDVKDSIPVPMYYKSKPIHLPNYMASITPEGGIVSTAKETMIFLKAFFSGYFFPKAEINEMKKWNLNFPPPGLFFYGIGLERLWVPRFITPFKPIKEILGFWGQSGAFAFFNPETDLYFTGTVNQLSGFGHSAAFKAMIKIIKSI